MLFNFGDFILAISDSICQHSMLYFLFRLHPKIKNIDMLHAPDYVNMKRSQMENKMSECNKKDVEVTRAME